MIDTTDVQISTSVGHTLRPMRAFMNVDLPRLNSPQTKMVVAEALKSFNCFESSAIFFPLFACVI